ncbi:unnamed protein product [Caenorhabditis angaria]|uniref:G-protein coupled receptors family 1 profile domain-containing protein n=1 Tax=Caenorhabditis angaria TaxID=860376 RepID=A0A9P1IZN4_9PELO|nr:unnamed protein product [Caenorhabditis angaria]
MNETENETMCSKSEGYDSTRYALIVYCGTPIAIAGVICNWILFRLFMKSKSMKSPTFYLLILAILDLLMDLLYIPFFTVDALAIADDNQFLYHLWHYYAMFVFGLSKLIQFASTYVILCATIERFIVVAEIASLDFLISSTGRFATITSTFIMALILRIPGFFEYRIVYQPECPVYECYNYEPILASWQHYKVYNFYVMNVLQIFVPFALLLIINISIVIVTKRRLTGIGWAVTTFIDMPKVSEMIRKESLNSNQRRRDELRYATWTMVSIATTYLCCSSLSLFIGVLENVTPENELLYTEDGSSTVFYTLATDTVSILVAVNSLLRIFVYMLCSPNFRTELLTEYPIFRCVCCCSKTEESAKKIKEDRKLFIGYQNLIMGPRVDML